MIPPFRIAVLDLASEDICIKDHCRLPCRDLHCPVKWHKGILAVHIESSPGVCKQFVVSIYNSLAFIQISTLLGEQVTELQPVHFQKFIGTLVLNSDADTGTCAHQFSVEFVHSRTHLEQLVQSQCRRVVLVDDPVVPRIYLMVEEFIILRVMRMAWIEDILNAFFRIGLEISLDRIYYFLKSSAIYSAKHRFTVLEVREIGDYHDFVVASFELFDRSVFRKVIVEGKLHLVTVFQFLSDSSCSIIPETVMVAHAAAGSFSCSSSVFIIHISEGHKVVLIITGRHLRLLKDETYHTIQQPSVYCTLIYGPP